MIVADLEAQCKGLKADIEQQITASGYGMNFDRADSPYFWSRQGRDRRIISRSASETREAGKCRICNQANR